MVLPGNSFFKPESHSTPVRIILAISQSGLILPLVRQLLFYKPLAKVKAFAILKRGLSESTHQARLRVD